MVAGRENLEAITSGENTPEEFENTSEVSKVELFASSGTEDTKWWRIYRNNGLFQY